MTFEIKVGIPAPDVRSAGRPTSKYPFGQMLVGTSFFVDVKGDEDVAGVVARLRSNVNRWKKSAAKVDGAVFRVAPFLQDGVPVLNPVTKAKQVGVWRVE